MGKIIGYVGTVPIVRYPAIAAPSPITANWHDRPRGDSPHLSDEPFADDFDSAQWSRFLCGSADDE